MCIYLIWGGADFVTIHNAGKNRKRKMKQCLRRFQQLSYDLKSPVNGEEGPKSVREGRNDIHAPEHSNTVHSAGQEVMSQALAEWQEVIFLVASWSDFPASSGAGHTSTHPHPHTHTQELARTDTSRVSVSYPHDLGRETASQLIPKLFVCWWGMAD